MSAFRACGYRLGRARGVHARLPAKGFVEDQKVAKVYGAVPVKIKSCVIPRTALIQAEVRGELQKVGEVNHAVAVKVRIGGLRCDVR